MNLDDHRCKHGNEWGECCGIEHPERQFKSNALTILKEASDCIQERAIQRDESGKRSMERTVRAFNALTGNDLSEEDGWFFMVCLKSGRAYSGHDRDNYIDGSAYFALAGEAADNESL